MSTSRVGTVLSKFGSNMSNVSVAATDKQAEQKRQASKRALILQNANTPQGGKDKWNGICKLAKGKNQAQADFTTVLFKDAGEWTDALLQASVSEKNIHARTRTQLSAC